MEKMKFLEWDLKYLVGVPEIDGHHKEFMSQINEAIYHSSGNKEKERKFFDKRIENSIKFIAKHFETEGQYLPKGNCEKIKEHKMEHKNLLEKIQDLKQKIQNNEREFDLFSTTAFFKEMLLGHIKEFDVNIMKYFLEGKK